MRVSGKDIVIVSKNIFAANWSGNLELRSLMCRSIKPLFNFDPPVTDDEIRAAARQFVRKISGYNKPPKVNEEAFETALEEITLVSKRLLDSLETAAPKKNREVEREKARLAGMRSRSSVTAGAG